MAYTVVIDAGHGGSDPGANYEGRQEKDDALRLALAVGNILEENGINVEYTRTSDVYNTPFEKAMMGNNANADLFVSIHRDSVLTPNTREGVSTLVFNDEGFKSVLARNINSNLEEIGFSNNGVSERPNLVVLKRTKMPSVLVETGFINNDKDNEIFDNNFMGVANAIADGILESINIRQVSGMQTELPVLYRVQVGAFTNMDNAVRLENTLRRQGYNTIIVSTGNYK